MKTIRLLCSVSSVYFQGGKGAILEVDDHVAFSEVNAGNAEFIDTKDIPVGLQQPKRKPIIDVPEVHATIIGNDDKKVVKPVQHKKKPAKK